MLLAAAILPIGTETFWQPVAVSLVAVFGVWVTARAALQDVALKRRLETAARFVDLTDRVQNGLASGQMPQIAAIYLIGAFGRDENHLRDAARAALTNVTEWPGDEPSRVKVRDAAADALKLLS